MISRLQRHKNKWKHSSENIPNMFYIDRIAFYKIRDHCEHFHLIWLLKDLSPNTTMASVSWVDSLEAISNQMQPFKLEPAEFI